MTWLEISLAVACIYLMLAPPKYDPAIRLKEWLEAKRKDTP